MSVDITSRATALYRLFGTSGEPVYFGISLNPQRRLKQHARRSRWWPEVDESRTVIEWFDDRPAAEAAELTAIRTEAPRHNVVTSDDQGCAMFLPRSDGRSWGKPKWTPPTQQIAEDLERMADAYRRWREGRKAFEQAVAALVDPEGDDVPVGYLAKQLGVERKSIYRIAARASAAKP